MFDKILELLFGKPETTTIYGKGYEPKGRVIVDKPLIDTITPSPSPKPSLDNLSDRISRGLANSAFKDAPIATLSSSLADAGENLPDPFLPTIMALMESRGLQDQKPKQAANPYNILNNGQPVDYEGNPSLAISGGTDSQGVKRRGFKGIMRKGGIYDDYLQSGNLSNFFSKFTPESDPLNPSNKELVERYNS